MSVLERLTSLGPKRLLALDGSGIRGAITLGFLEQMARLLRARLKREDLKLYDYFDLIGGTSTGAIIASGLAIGMPVGFPPCSWRTRAGRISCCCNTCRGPKPRG
jgi:patatin-like phospholipase/acyl hydrolase